MAQLAPVAPKSFYVGGLQGLKDSASTPLGTITLLSDVPDDVDACWAEVGAGIDAGGQPVGTLVLGKAQLVGVSEVVAGDVEPGSTETGWKLSFSPIPDVEATADGTAKAIAILISNATLATGSDTDVLYIVDMSDLPLTNGTLYNVPGFEIEIQYGENK